MDGHILIIGHTLCGKTTLAKRLASEYKKKRITSVVLDPLSDPEWPTNIIFKTSEAFFTYAKDSNKCRSCALFVDESGLALNKFDQDLLWLTTTSRHHGHRAHIIAQRAEMVNKTIRSQCLTLICFGLNPKDAREYALDWNCEEVFHNAPKLQRYQYMVISRYSIPTYHTLTKN